MVRAPGSRVRCMTSVATCMNEPPVSRCPSEYQVWACATYPVYTGCPVETAARLSASCRLDAIVAASFRPLRSAAAWAMSGAYRWRAASGTFGPTSNAVVAVTSASDRERYMCCVLRLSGSLTETTSWAADACWVTVHAPTAPQASEASRRLTMSRRSRVGVVAAASRLEPRPGGATGRWPGGGAAADDAGAGDWSAIYAPPFSSAPAALAGPAVRAVQAAWRHADTAGAS